jgi:hypothetical protein
MHTRVLPASAHTHATPFKPKTQTQTINKQTNKQTQNNQLSVICFNVRPTSECTLTNLHLSDNGLTPRLAQSLSTPLALNTTLTNLDLRYNPLADHGAAALASALSRHPTMLGLVLWSCKIGPLGASSLGHLLSVNSTLASLDVGMNSFGYAGMTALAHGILKNACLRAQDTDGSAAQQPRRLLGDDGKRLSGASDGGGDSASDSGARGGHGAKNRHADEALAPGSCDSNTAPAAAPGGGLRTLGVASCSLGDEGAVALAEAIAGGCVERIDARGNGIGVAGIVALGCAVARSERVWCVHDFFFFFFFFFFFLIFFSKN